MIEAGVLARMYSQIVQGVEKDQSTLVADDEHAQAWDTIAGEVASLRETGVEFEVPFDDPGVVADFEHQRMADDAPWPPEPVAREDAEAPAGQDEPEQSDEAPDDEGEAEATDE